MIFGTLASYRVKMINKTHRVILGLVFAVYVDTGRTDRSYKKRKKKLMETTEWPFRVI